MLMHNANHYPFGSFMWGRVTGVMPCRSNPNPNYKVSEVRKSEKIK